MKMFKCPSRLILHFYVNTMLRTFNTARDKFFSEAFLVVVIHQYFFFIHVQIKTLIPFCFCSLSLITFIVVLPFFMNFKYNFGLNFNTISLFLLKLKNFIWFPSYQKKSLGLLELASKM